MPERLKCPRKDCDGLLEQKIVQFGRVVDYCAQCERRLAGICRDCPAPVEGEVGKAIRCRTHKRQRKNASWQRYVERDGVREQRNAAQRERSRRPEAKARKRERGRQWRAKNPDKVRRHKRKYLLREGAARAKYLETQRRHNADPIRAQKKRDLARQRYYEAHPNRPDLRCRKCGTDLSSTWSPGKGRPRQTCDNCCTPAELQRRRKGYNLTAYRRQRDRAA